MRGFLSRALFFYAVWTCLVTGIGWAQTPPGREDPKSSAFAHIREMASSFTSVSSEFSEERHLSMLKEPLLSKGRFLYKKPGLLYWEVTGPVPSGFSVNGTRAKRWKKDPRSAETFAIETEPIANAIMEQVNAWAKADFPSLEKRYVISLVDPQGTSLRLAPKAAREKKYLSHMIITFSENWGHVASVEIHEKGGDYLRIAFLNPRTNVDLPEGLFELP